MTEKQRFLVYIKLGNLLADVRKNYDISICDALKFLLEKEILQKIEDLETGYYLEGSAYLSEVLQIKNSLSA